jgi:hypothetical protein
MRRADRLTAMAGILLLVIMAITMFSAEPCWSAENEEPTGSEVMADKMLADLSDEEIRQLIIESDDEVRQLLIEGLKEEALSSEASPRKMKGPAFFLSRLLRALSSQHDDSENEVRALFSSLPTMWSDLYRVFVKL